MSKMVLILGASSDIAKAVARELAGQGFGLILAGRDMQELEKDGADFALRYSVPVTCCFLDITDFESHQDFWMALNVKPYGCVCAIGYMGVEEEIQKSQSEARRVIDTNLTGCMSVLDMMASHLELQGEGFIIGISSVAGDRGRASNYHYGAAKAGFTAYLSGLRNRFSLLGNNVKILTVKPGFVDTRMTRGMNLPAKLTAQPEQVARDVMRGLQKNKGVLYSLWVWRYIMLIIVHIPEFVFRKTKL